MSESHIIQYFGSICEAVRIKYEFVNQIFPFFWFSCFFRGVCFSEAVFHFFWKVFCIYGCPNVSLVSHGPKISLKRIVISLGVLLVTKPLGATSKNPMLLPCLNRILLAYFGSLCEAGRIKYDFVGDWLCWTGPGDCFSSCPGDPWHQNGPKTSPKSLRDPARRNFFMISNYI